MKKSVWKHRFLPLLLTTALLCGIWAMPIAAEGVAATVSNDTAFAGDTVTLTVTLSSSVTVKSGSVAVSYDETVLSLTSGSWGVTNTVLGTFDLTNKVGAFAYQSATAIQGVIFSATFQVLENATVGATSVSMDVRLKDQSNTDITVSNTPGIVTVATKAEGLVSTVNSVSATPGQMVSFTARLSESVIVKSGSVRLTYDKTVLKLESGAWNLTNAMLVNFDLAKEVGAFAYSGGNAINGVVFTATFTVLDTAPAGESAVGMTLQLTDESGSILEITNMNGKITVNAANGLSVSVNDAVACTGETVVFTATLSEAVAIKSGAVSLNYDKTVLQPVSGAWNISNAMLNWYDPAKEVGAFAYSAVTEINGTIFTMTFRVMDAAAVGTTEVGLVVQLKDEANQSVAIQNKAGRMTVKPAELISASIVWSSMSFTYTDGEWNPGTHDYEAGTWKPDVENGGQITVINEGNVDITATFVYTPTVSEISGAFTKQSVALAAGGTDTVSLTLSGRPKQAMLDEKLGAVTVTIAKSGQG